MRAVLSASAQRSSGGGTRFGAVRQGGKHANPIILGGKRQRLVSTGRQSAPLCSLRVASESRRGMKNEFGLEICA